MAAIGERGKVESGISGTASGLKPFKAPPAAESLRRCATARVLVVDDGQDLCDLVCDILKLKGMESTSARDGRDGLARFRSGDFDVVVSDVHMPVMDGITMLRELKKISPDTPVIIAFGGEQEEADEAMAAGAFSVVRKPYDMMELVKEIRRALDTLPEH